MTTDGLTRDDVLAFFGRDEADEAEYPCLVEWACGMTWPGLLSTRRAESSYGLPVLAMCDREGGEVVFGLGDLAARGGALLRLCADDDSSEGLDWLKRALAAGYGAANSDTVSELDSPDPRARGR